MWRDHAIAWLVISYVHIWRKYKTGILLRTVYEENTTVMTLTNIWWHTFDSCNSINFMLNTQIYSYSFILRCSAVGTSKFCYGFMGLLWHWVNRIASEVTLKDVGDIFWMKTTHTQKNPTIEHELCVIISVVIVITSFTCYCKKIVNTLITLRQYMFDNNYNTNCLSYMNGIC